MEFLIHKHGETRTDSYCESRKVGLHKDLVDKVNLYCSSMMYPYDAITEQKSIFIAQYGTLERSTHSTFLKDCIFLKISKPEINC